MSKGKVAFALLVGFSLAGLIAWSLKEDLRVNGMKCRLLDSETPYKPQQKMLCEDGKVYDR